MTGLELQRQLASQNKNNLPIVFLTGHGDVESAVYTLKKGAFDFLQKPINPLVLNKVVEEASRKSLLDTINQVEEEFARYRTLTPREKNVNFAANGKTNKEISKVLNITVPTIKMHGDAISWTFTSR